MRKSGSHRSVLRMPKRLSIPLDLLVLLHLLLRRHLLLPLLLILLWLLLLVELVLLFLHILLVLVGGRLVVAIRGQALTHAARVSYTAVLNAIVA
jgi:hypothetical protein